MVECFSRLESVRCQGLSRTNYIVLYLPTGLELLLVPVLLGLTWRRPRPTIIFLLINVLLNGVVGTWDLLVKLTPPSPQSFRSQDLALGTISALPVLFILLFANSILVSDFRSCLPRICQTSTSALLYSFIMVPLVPIALVGTLLGNVLFVVYFESLSSVKIGFETLALRKMNHGLSIAGITAATIFFAFVSLVSLFIIVNKQSRARWILDYPSRPSLGLISLGLALTSLSLGLGLADESFAMMISRNVMELASRVLITIGIVGAYYPLSSNVKQPNTSERPRPSLALERSPRRPARQTGMTIGGPISGSFKKMDASGSRSFHQQSLRRTAGRSPVPHHDRVISRHSPRHGPKLSFTPSTFDQSNLSSLGEAVRDRDRLVQEAETMEDEEHTNPFSSPEDQDDQTRRPLKKNVGSIYRPKLVPVEERELTHWPPEVDDSYLRPVHPVLAINRQGSEAGTIPISIPPADLPIPRLKVREPLATPTGSLSGQVLSARLSPGERVGQVSAFRTVDQLYPTPVRRGPSSRRKPVPRDNHSPHQSIAGILSFISTSTTPAPPGSPNLSPSAEAAWDDSFRRSIPRRLRRRETDPTRAMMTRSIGEESSIYSQPSQLQDETDLFYRAPISSPSSSSPAKSVRSPGPAIPPRRSSIRPPPSAMLPDRSTRYQSDSALALSSLNRVRRDTGVDLGLAENRLTPLSRDSAHGSASGLGTSPGLNRLGTTTWVSDGISPRASERGWWSNVKMDD